MATVNSPLVVTVPKRNTRLPFGVAIFCGAFLLFQVQLILGKYILPWFGGGPAVWTTCMLFFQVLLLGGYLYTHSISTRLQLKAQVWFHATALVAALVCIALGFVFWGTPILPGANWRPASPDHPGGSILVLLSAAIGLPYLVLSTTGPLLQSWFARVNIGESPYRLYALSNFGSLLGLSTYPFFFEPALGLHAQAWTWSAGFVVFAGSLLVCGREVKVRAAGPQTEDENPVSALAGAQSAPGVATQWFWFLLAAFPSLMLLATTNLICQEVAVIPFLWVLPLSLYLLSLIICFDNPAWYGRAIFYTLLGLCLPLSVLGLLSTSPPKPMVLLIGIFSATLFACCMVCHGELTRLKPHPAFLTRFYLLVSAGGAAGGIFVALIAPRIFSSYTEFHFGLVGCVLLVLATLVRDRQSWWHHPPPALGSLLFLGVALLPHLYVRYKNLLNLPDAFYDFHYYGMLTCLCAGVAVFFLWARKRVVPQRKLNLTQVMSVLIVIGLGAGLRSQISEGRVNAISRQRNFYGVLDISRTDNGSLVLRHGTTMHGSQSSLTPRVPNQYYSYLGGLGLWMRSRPACAETCGLRYGLVGMGAGTIAAYGRSGEVMRFYEINPQVIAYSASANAYFTYIRDSAAKVEVAAGDARLSLERELNQSGPQNFDLLVVDAFNSDSIPVHLMTQEAVQLYLKHLRGPDSVIAFHISNRVLDLRPVLVGLAGLNHLSYVRLHRRLSFDMGDTAEWVLMSRNPEALKMPAFEGHIAPMPPPDQGILWTDDYSNLFKVLKRAGPGS